MLFHPVRRPGENLKYVRPRARTNSCLPGSSSMQFPTASRSQFRMPVGGGRRRRRRSAVLLITGAHLNNGRRSPRTLCVYGAALKTFKYGPH